MSLRSLLIAFIGLALAATSAAALTGPANAARVVPDRDAAQQVRPVEPAHQALRAKPKRDLHDTIVKRRGHLIFKGHVEPPHGPVIIQKKSCRKGCTWKHYRKVRTVGPRARWHVRIGAPRHGSWFWRGYVRASGKYGKSFTGIWRTYTI